MKKAEGSHMLPLCPHCNRQLDAVPRPDQDEFTRVTRWYCPLCEKRPPFGIMDLRDWPPTGDQTASILGDPVRTGPGEMTIIPRDETVVEAAARLAWLVEKGKLAQDSYATLRAVLDRALAQASGGKGRERHAVEGEPFERQQICEVTRRLGHGFSRGQAVKKIYEAQRLPRERAVAELLGAINYIAASIIVLEEGE